LQNTYRSDVVLHEHLERLLPPEVRAEVEPELDQMGEAAAGPLARLAEQAEASPPRLVPYDAWGRRVDRIEVSPAWSELHAVQARAGLCALPYESRHGRYDRIVQHALLHLYGPSSAVYSCPVAMTDAAVRVLVDHAPAALRDRVAPCLTSRDPGRAWTSGQWMTEREGGSDVGGTATVAWIMVVFLVPFLGVLAYHVAGRPRLPAWLRAVVIGGGIASYLVILAVGAVVGGIA